MLITYGSERVKVIRLQTSLEGTKVSNSKNGYLCSNRTFLHRKTINKTALLQ